jgi:hypothetical protein
MGTYRIMDSSHEMQFGPATEAETMASMFEPLELILMNEPPDSLDLEKLDPISGEWRRMCTVVRETEAIFTSR